MAFNWNMTFHEEHVSLPSYDHNVASNYYIISTYINHTTIVITVYQFWNWITILFWCVSEGRFQKKKNFMNTNSQVFTSFLTCAHIHTHNHGTQTIDRPVPIVIPRHTRGEICCPWCENFLQWQEALYRLRRFSYDIRVIIVPVFLHNPCSACSNHHPTNNTNCPTLHFVPVKKKP